MLSVIGFVQMLVGTYWMSCGRIGRNRTGIFLDNSYPYRQINCQKWIINKGIQGRPCNTICGGFSL